MVEGGGTSNTATLYYPNWYVDVEQNSDTVSVCSQALTKYIHRLLLICLLQGRE